MGTTSNQKLTKLEKLDIEITLEKIYQHLLIERDRKINELAEKEIQQRDLMKYKKLSYDDVWYEFLEITNLFNYIRAIKIVMRFAKLLKSHSLSICNAQQNRKFEEIQDLQRYMESLIWCSNKIKKSYLKEFSILIQDYFGQIVFQELTKFQNVDEVLKSLLEKIEPNKREIDQYLQRFLYRYNIQMKDFEGCSIDTKDISYQIKNLQFNDNSQNINQYTYQNITLNSNQTSPYIIQQHISQDTQNSNQEDDNSVDWLLKLLNEQNGVSDCKDGITKKKTAMQTSSKFITQEFLPIDDRDQQQSNQVNYKNNYNQQSINFNNDNKCDRKQFNYNI